MFNHRTYKHYKLKKTMNNWSSFLKEIKIAIPCHMY